MRIKVEVQINDRVYIFFNYPYSPYWIDSSGHVVHSRNWSIVKFKLNEPFKLKWQSITPEDIGNYHRARKKEKEREMNAKQHDEVMEQAIALPKFPARKQDGTREDEPAPEVTEQETPKK